MLRIELIPKKKEKKEISQSERLDGDRKRAPPARLDDGLWWDVEQQRVSSLSAVRVGVNRAGAGECTLDQDVQRNGWRLARGLGGGAWRIHGDAGRRRRDVGRWRRDHRRRRAGVLALF